MNPREEAAWELHQFFAELDMSYAIIGGVAVQTWGQPRLPRDVVMLPQFLWINHIEGIVYRQRDALDVAIISHWLSAFAELLDSPEIVERFERPWHRIHTNERPL